MALRVRGQGLTKGRGHGRDQVVPTDRLDLLRAERDALKQDLRDAEAEIARLGNQVWQLESERLARTGRQLDISAEGTTR